MLTLAAPPREIGPEKPLASLDRTGGPRETARPILYSVQCARSARF
jgi:hypothetical protein